MLTENGYLHMHTTHTHTQWVFLFLSLITLFYLPQILEHYWHFFIELEPIDH